MQRLSRADRPGQLIILAVCVGILTVAALLQPADGPGSALRIGAVDLPEICTLKAATGLPCPGCGLTRSTVAAVHGDVRSSLAHHRLGLVVVGYLLLQIVARAAALASPGNEAGARRLRRILDRGLIVLGILIALNWIPTLIY